MTQKAQPSIWVKKITQDFLECMHVHMGPGRLGARQAEGTFNWNKGTNVEPCTARPLSDSLSEFSAREFYVC